MSHDGPASAPHFVNDQLERLLGPSTSSNRVARRRFKRIMTKHWPLTPEPDPARHPRLCLFVERYQAAMLPGKSGALVAEPDPDPLYRR